MWLLDSWIYWSRLRIWYMKMLMIQCQLSIILLFVSRGTDLWREVQWECVCEGGLMMMRRRVWDPDVDARNQNGENNANKRSRQAKYQRSERNISVTIKNIFLKKCSADESVRARDPRERTHGGDANDEDAAVRAAGWSSASASAAEMKQICQIRCSDARGRRATWISLQSHTPSDCSFSLSCWMWNSNRFTCLFVYYSTVRFWLLYSGSFRPSTSVLKALNISQLGGVSKWCFCHEVMASW